MDVTFTHWAVLVVLVVGLLLLDLFVLHRGAHEISIRDALWSTAGFIGVSVVFGIVLGLREGTVVAQQFFAGYVLEKSLSLDNVFVWSLIFSAFAVPARYQHRVLHHAVFTALILRGAFVAAGAGLLAAFEWIVYVFGGLLLWSGIRLLRGRRPPDPERGPITRLIRRLPTTRGLASYHIFVPAPRVADDRRPARRPILGRWYATPLLAVLVAIELSDVIFAVDSIPAIFGVTREPFIVYSATALALLGLRSMYFLLAGLRDSFRYLDVGLAVLLVFIGGKFLLTDVVEIGPAESLLAIVLVMTTAIVASLLRRPQGRESQNGGVASPRGRPAERRPEPVRR